MTRSKVTYIKMWKKYNLGILSEPNAHNQTMYEMSAGFQKDWLKPVKELRTQDTYSRYIYPR